MQADAVTRGHVKGLNAGRPDPGHLSAHFVGQADNTPAFFVGNMSGGIQMNAAEAGQRQRLAEGLFHGMELVAGIGRGAVVDASGVGEAVSGCRVNEDPHRFQLHEGMA
jgi:hypothetical protein